MDKSSFKQAQLQLKATKIPHLDLKSMKIRNQDQETCNSVTTFNQ